MFNLAICYEKRGRSYYKISDNKNALNDLNKAIEFDSGNSENYYFRAILYRIEGDNFQAMRDVSNAISINPKESTYKSFFKSK